MIDISTHTKFFSALDHCQGAGQRSILLGNGFSQTIHPEFQYNSLVDLIKKNDLINSAEFVGDKARLLRILDSDDLEKTIHHLLVYSDIVQIYVSDPEDVKRKMQKDAETLKALLVAAIQTVHPDKRGKISDNKYAKCLENLKKFNYIFTTNYDLLLEWTLMAVVGKKKIDHTFNDGFKFYRPHIKHIQHYVSDSLPYTRIGEIGDHKYLNRKSGNLQNIFYLHGALHLFTANAELTKTKGTKDDNDIMLLPYLQALTAGGRIPHIVAEGSAPGKKETILKNTYLRDAYHALESRSGTLFIFGSKLEYHDEHIGEAIVKSNIEKIYYGYRKSLKEDHEHMQIEGKIRSWIAERQSRINSGKQQSPPLEIEFCDTAGQSFWGYE